MERSTAASLLGLHVTVLGGILWVGAPQSGGSLGIALVVLGTILQLGVQALRVRPA